jgi:hypothetical protein
MISHIPIQMKLMVHWDVFGSFIFHLSRLVLRTRKVKPSNPNPCNLAQVARARQVGPELAHRCLERLHSNSVPQIGSSIRLRTRLLQHSARSASWDPQISNLWPDSDSRWLFTGNIQHQSYDAYLHHLLKSRNM